MQIWIVTYNYGTVKAGPVIRFVRYAALFKESGYELIFVTKKRADDQEFMIKGGVKSIHLPCTTSSDHVKKAIELSIKTDLKPICLIFFSVKIENYLDFSKARKAGLKLIYVSTMRLDLNIEQAKKRSWLKKKLLEFGLKSVYSQMDKIVSSTKALQQDLVDLGIADRKLKVIYNGVNIQKFAPVSWDEKIALRRELKIPEQGIVFLFVGLFVHRKGILDLIKTFNALYRHGENFKLLIVGQDAQIAENPPNFDHEWSELKTRGVNDGWLLIHPFSEEIHKYYKAVDSFVFMSKLEGMPNVLIEAMSAGLPVLTCRFDGFSDDYGTSGEHFLELYRDVSEDGRVIFNVLKDKSIRTTVGQNARKWAENNFAVANSINEYIDIIVGEKQ
jgi:glycosyltransferase involved in cell wall biosynthesis